MRIKNIFIILILCIICFSFKTEAQIGNTNLESFIIELSPKSPGQNTNVTAKIISYSFDVDRAYITWKLNNEIIKQGLGEKTIRFTTEGIGSNIYLLVSLTTNEGLFLQKSKNFSICDVDLLWEAMTYTPPGYKSKALPSSRSGIKITAVPHGMGANHSMLIYEWKKNYKNMPNASGVGKNSFRFLSSKTYEEDTITLNVSNSDKSKSTEKTIRIRPGMPKILFYEESLIEGPKYNKALEESFILTAPQINIKAEPYFFSQKDIENLSFSWKLNNKTISPFTKANMAGLSAPEQGKGFSSLNIEIFNPINMLQYAEKSLRINFGL